MAATDGVRVIGRADGDRVDPIAELVEHFAVIGKCVLDLLFLQHAVERVLVDVAQRENLAELGCVSHVAVALAAHADAADLNLFVRRSALLRLQPAGNPITHPNGCRCLNKTASIGHECHVESPTIGIAQAPCSLKKRLHVRQKA